MLLRENKTKNRKKFLRGRQKKKNTGKDVGENRTP
jgi:hypothetical protein